MSAQAILPRATVLGALMAVALSAGCASQPETQASAQPQPAPVAATSVAAQPAAPAASAAPAAQPTETFFIIYHENGRIYPIADTKNYLEFLENGELIYTRTRIGAGPEGETIVFGIEKKEADDLGKPARAEVFFDGKYEPTGPFYAEVIRDGRFYVFGSWADFKDYLAHKELTYTFAEIGTGPRGETVIYALNKDTVKAGRPVQLVEQFKKLHKIN